MEQARKWKRGFFMKIANLVLGLISSLNMLTTWLSGVIENGEKVMVWPEVGFVLTAIMIVLTVLNAIKNKDSQAY